MKRETCKRGGEDFPGSGVAPWVFHAVSSVITSCRKGGRLWLRNRHFQSVSLKCIKNQFTLVKILNSTPQHFRADTRLSFALCRPSYDPEHPANKVMLESSTEQHFACTFFALWIRKLLLAAGRCLLLAVCRFSDPPVTQPSLFSQAKITARLG